MAETTTTPAQAPAAPATTEPTQSSAAPPTAPSSEWQKDIPKEYQNEAVWARYQGKPVGEVLKAYAEANRFIGGAIKLPGKDAKPEELTALRTKLVGAGVIEAPPASPDAYQVTPPANLPENVSWNPEGQKGFLQAAHKLGMTQAQVQGTLAWYGDYMGGVLKQEGMSQEEAVGKLKTEWGPLFEKKVTLASRAIREIGGEEALQLLNSRGLGNDPVIVKMMATIGEQLAEDHFIPGHVEGVLTAEDARGQINKIMNDTTDLYHAQHAGKPGHAERVTEVGDLFRLAYPG